AIGEHGGVVLDRDPQQVVDLPLGEELGLVEQQAADGAATLVCSARALACEPVEEGLIRCDREADLPLGTEARADRVVALRADRGFREQPLVPALLVVVGGVQERGALAGVHRPVAEIQLRHYSRYPSSAARRISSAFFPAGRPAFA